MSFTPNEMKVIERFRKTELYKLDNQSDFKTLRECFKVSKQLYEALKYFDSRSTRYRDDFNSYNQKIYSKKRSFVYPSEFYTFRFFDKEISIQRGRSGYFVGCLNFRSWTFPSELEFDSGFYKYASTKVFSEVKISWFKILFEFLDREFSYGVR